MTLGNPQSIFDQRVYAQATEPADNRAGTLWVDTSTEPPVTKAYDTGSQSYVRVSVQNTEISDTEPSNPSEGDGWIDTSLNPPRFKLYDGASWNLSAPVTSVNGSTGDVSLAYGDLSDTGSDPVDSVNGQTGAVSVNDIGWFEDSNSPQTESNSADLSYTFGDVYDEYLIVLENITHEGSFDDDLLFRFNGYTGSNYNYYEANGGRSSGSTRITLVGELDVRFDDVNGEIRLNSAINSDMVGGSADMRTADQDKSATRFSYGDADPADAPVSEFTLYWAVENISGTVHVYGRDVY